MAMTRQQISAYLQPANLHTLIKDARLSIFRANCYIAASAARLLYAVRNDRQLYCEALGKFYHMHAITLKIHGT